MMQKLVWTYFYYILDICLLEEEINIMIDIIIPVYNAEKISETLCE